MIKILTWNINHRKNASALWDYLIKEHADIVLLQESKPEHDSEKRAGFSGFFVKNSGLATYSKYPITKIELGIPFRVLATSILSSGANLIMLNVHNFPGDKNGEYTGTLNRTLDAVEDFIKKSKNLIIGGDLNAGLYFDRKYGGTENAKVLNRIESYGLARYPAKEEQTHRHMRYKNAPYPDDFIFVDRSLEVHSYKVLTDLEVMALSDHNPVVVEIEV
jgi:endonuclease/exonuclease/phosphatase family metal-dependent hydrolase